MGCAKPAKLVKMPFEMWTLRVYPRKYTRWVQIATCEQAVRG